MYHFFPKERVKNTPKGFNFLPLRRVPNTDRYEVHMEATPFYNFEQDVIQCSDPRAIDTDYCIPLEIFTLMRGPHGFLVIKDGSGNLSAGILPNYVNRGEESREFSAAFSQMTFHDEASEKPMALMGYNLMDDKIVFLGRLNFEANPTFKAKSKSFMECSIDELFLEMPNNPHILEASREMLLAAADMMDDSMLTPPKKNNITPIRPKEVPKQETPKQEAPEIVDIAYPEPVDDIPAELKTAQAAPVIVEPREKVVSATQGPTEEQGDFVSAKLETTEEQGTFIAANQESVSEQPMPVHAEQDIVDALSDTQSVDVPGNTSKQDDTIVQLASAQDNTTQLIEEPVSKYDSELVEKPLPAENTEHPEELAPVEDSEPLAELVSVEEPAREGKNASNSQEIETQIVTRPATIQDNINRWQREAIVIDVEDTEDTLAPSAGTQDTSEESEIITIGPSRPVVTMFPVDGGGA